jgi:hypothetical protein
LQKHRSPGDDIRGDLARNPLLQSRQKVVDGRRFLQGIERLAGERLVSLLLERFGPVGRLGRE